MNWRCFATECYVLREKLIAHETECVVLWRCQLLNSHMCVELGENSRDHQPSLHCQSSTSATDGIRVACVEFAKRRFS